MAKISLEELLKLPAAERAELAVALWDSLDDLPEGLPLTEEQRTELDRRLAAHNADPTDGVGLGGRTSAAASRLSVSTDRRSTGRGG